MAFKNEYVPTIDQELSGFRDKARKTFKIGCGKYDRWTIDDEREMVLVSVGIRRDVDTENCYVWDFMWQSNICRIETERRLFSEPAKDEYLVVYEITDCRAASGCLPPDLEMLKLFKEALIERSRWGVFEPNYYTRVQLTLLKEGEEV